MSIERENLLRLLESDTYESVAIALQILYSGAVDWDFEIQESVSKHTFSKCLNISIRSVYKNATRYHLTESKQYLGELYRVISGFEYVYEKREDVCFIGLSTTMRFENNNEHPFLCYTFTDAQGVSRSWEYYREQKKQEAPEYYKNILAKAKT